MKAKVSIDKSTAIRLGIEPLGDHEVEIDLSSLSPDDRALIAAAYEVSGLSNRYLYEYEPKYGGATQLRLAAAPTTENIVARLKEVVAARAAEKEAEAAKRAELVEQAREVLRERRTRPAKTYGAERYRGHDSVAIEPAWPGDRGTSVIKDVVESPDAIAWQREIDAKNKRERDRIDAIVEEEERTKEGARLATESIRDGWIREHGSERLRWLLDEGLELDAVYRDERLALERPGWQWSARVDGAGKDPRNPPLEAKAILDEARKLEPGAVLRWLVVEHEHDESCEGLDEDCQTYQSTRYIAGAEFLGKEILFPREA